MDCDFVTAINCMDGRVQEPVLDYLKGRCDVNNVDMITVPGPSRVLTDADFIQMAEFIRDRVAISVNIHGSHLIALIGHHDCAGNPKPRSEQLEEIIDALELIKGWEFETKVLGLWVNSKFQVEVVV